MKAGDEAAEVAEAAAAVEGVEVEPLAAAVVVVEAVELHAAVVEVDEASIEVEVAAGDNRLRAVATPAVARTAAAVPDLAVVVAGAHRRSEVARDRAWPIGPRAAGIVRRWRIVRVVPVAGVRISIRAEVGQTSTRAIVR